MKVKSSKIVNKKRELNKHIDTMYVNTDEVYCVNDVISKNITKNIKNLIISKKYVVAKENYIEIYDTKANNLYYEGFSNFGDITIPIDFFVEEDLYLELINDKFKLNFKKINIIKENNKILHIDLDDNISLIKIYADSLGITIEVKSDKRVLYYETDVDGNIIHKSLQKYYLKKDDLDTFGNLDIRDYLNYENIYCDNIDINTLIIDKNIFKNKDKLDSLGLYEKNNDRPNIKNVRIIEENDMKLLPYDKTFEIEDILLNSGNRIYLYIKTKDDEVVLYLNNSNELKFISKNELLKDNEIKNVYFRFRKQTRVNGGIHNPLSIIIKEYKDGKLEVFDLISDTIINDMFKNNILSNKEMKKWNIDDSLYIKNNNWLGLFNSENFSDNLFRKMKTIHEEMEIIKNKFKENGLSNDAIKYLVYRDLLEKINIIKLSHYEVNAFNDLGNNYIKRKKLN